MKGARAELSVKTINIPTSTRMMTMGASHHFLRTRKKSQKSTTYFSFPTMWLLSDRQQ